MLQKIQLFADDVTVEIPVLSFIPGADPYVLKAITGLDPPDIESQLSGSVFNRSVYTGRRVPKRDIVIRIGINPNWFMEEPTRELRDNLIAMLEPAMDSDLVLMTFVDDIRSSRNIYGVIDKFEMPLASQDVEAQLTFICPEPNFTDEDYTVLTPNATSAVVNYEGTAKTGLELEIQPLSTISGSITLTQVETGAQIVLSDGSTFAPGSNLVINTTPGYRKITYGGVSRTSLLPLSPTWFNLRKGVNTFTMVPSSGSGQFSKATYRNEYWSL